MEYITRLTPNFLCWERPSGRDGKCNGELFETMHGFGWEEWLLKDYYTKKNKPNIFCEGFIQAFNGKNQSRVVKTLHLYTRVCKNQEGIRPGCYYLGYIENIQIGKFGQLSWTQVLNDLNRVGSLIPAIHEFNNVRFLKNDVHFLNDKEFVNYPILLNPGQGRFALYSLKKHQNLKKQINKYTK